ncbi:hypothetical protein SAMN04487939_10368 [Lysobacter sp. yr284]|uniref:hypothetical protein n=1 Tax=Lysobacter sp. yr284 TaxID=1761791 RepID=UPI000898F952|nr:hypothetical protein [Lysobacter sp. yr284]SDY53653.1 hypothetical protein SAMN04487939_10368 [Lysobacter sp. yr284]
MKLSHALLGAGFAGPASAACYDYQGTPANDLRWVVGLDNATGTADDYSLQIDNALLRNIRPAHCSGTYGCDIISYRIQWFGGSWTTPYLPGNNDFHTRGDGSVVKAWAMINDHNYQISYCN